MGDAENAGAKPSAENEVQEMNGGNMTTGSGDNMTSNIAARLRIAGERTDNRAFNNMETLCRQAADEIERLGETLVIVKQVAAEDFAEHDKKIGKLQADIERLRAALELEKRLAAERGVLQDKWRETLELISDPRGNYGVRDLRNFARGALDKAAPRDETTAEQR
ncbi:MAG TPA: hypothetical protein VMH41_16125 [Mycobacteriales bacterium]|nr:hypothetical protein [Mycobacteriales bacterium]